MEEWKAIPNTNQKLFVSNQGRILSLLSGKPRIIKTQKDAKGYQRFRISVNGKKTTFKLHREVAKAFIPNPNNLPQVNHIDGNKSNNKADNLEWTTSKENCHHAIKNGLWENVIKEIEKRKKPIIGYHNNESIRFNCIADAEKYIGSGNITSVLKGRRTHAKGWTFEYEKKILG